MLLARLYLRSAEGIRFFRTMNIYLNSSGNKTLTPKGILRLASQVSAELRGEVMTLVDYWRKEGEVKGKLEGKLEGLNEGLEKGKQEGKLEGIQEGEFKSKLEIARQMLAKNCKWDFITEITGVTKKQLDL